MERVTAKDYNALADENDRLRRDLCQLWQVIRAQQKDNDDLILWRDNLLDERRDLKREIKRLNDELDNQCAHCPFA